MLDLVIQGGVVVTPEDVGERDVGVQDGKIVAVTSPAPCPLTPGVSSRRRGKLSCPAVLSPMRISPFPCPNTGLDAQR